MTSDTLGRQRVVLQCAPAYVSQAAKVSKTSYRTHCKLSPSGHWVPERRPPAAGPPWPRSRGRWGGAPSAPSPSWTPSRTRGRCTPGIRDVNDISGTVYNSQNTLSCFKEQCITLTTISNVHLNFGRLFANKWNNLWVCMDSFQDL